MEKDSNPMENAGSDVASSPYNMGPTNLIETQGRNS